MRFSSYLHVAAFLGAALPFGVAVAEADATLAATPSDVPKIGSIRRADPFPRHDTLIEQTAFWRNVYGYWSQQQVALHDMDYPGIVYEVIDLPGPISDSYTAAQRKLVDEHRKDLQVRLQSLEGRYKDKASLSDAERELLYRIYTGADEGAVIGASERVRSQRGLRERFRRGVEISGRYEDSFRSIFKQAGLPEDLAYLPHVESSFQTNARSSAGAVGVWQFTRSAGRLFLKVNPAIDERLDPVASARGAARYLRRSHDVFGGDWAFAVTSYNHGVEGMLRARRQVGDDFSHVVRNYQSRSFGFASKNFYTEFLAARDVAGRHGDFFPEGLRIEPPLAIETVVLDRKTSAVQLAQIYGVSLKELTAINPAWSRRAARGDIPLPAGVEIWLPERIDVPARGAPIAIARAEEVRLLPAAPQIDSASQSVATSRNYHVVRRNETLYSIAKTYGTDIATLRQLNDMNPKNHVVKLGQKLKVVDTRVDRVEADAAAPTVASTQADHSEIIHVVRKGETAFDIAANYGVSLRSLMSSNELTKHSVIYPGQKFRIPRQ